MCLFLYTGNSLQCHLFINRAFDQGGFCLLVGKEKGSKKSIMQYLSGEKMVLDLSILQNKWTSESAPVLILVIVEIAQ